MAGFGKRWEMYSVFKKISLNMSCYCIGSVTIPNQNSSMRLMI